MTRRWDAKVVAMSDDDLTNLAATLIYIMLGERALRLLVTWHPAKPKQRRQGSLKDFARQG